jgi:hypothetical protein
MESSPEVPAVKGPFVPLHTRRLKDMIWLTLICTANSFDGFSGDADAADPLSKYLFEADDDDDDDDIYTTFLHR